MRKLNIKIGNKKYIVSVAETDEQQKKGLQDVKELPDEEGMLFTFEGENVSFWMEDTLIPLDIIFIDEDMEVISVHNGTPNSREAIQESNVYFVLEVNLGSGIKKGDELEIESDYDVKSNKMLVLNEDGTPQMVLDGEERIFSRNNTKTLIKFAKKAELLKKDSDYKALGKRIFKFLDEQDNRPNEYVDIK